MSSDSRNILYNMFLYGNMFLYDITCIHHSNYFYSGNLLLEEERRQGFMSTLHIKCSSCENVEVLNTSSSISNRGTSFDVNRRLVYNSIETGCGYEGLATLCSTLNMPCMSTTAYYKQMDNIMDVLESECKEEMIRVGAKA